MGANAVTSVYDFTAGQVLTAAQMDNVNCGIPVFATTTTRDAAFGGTGEKTLAQGQYAYIEANSQLQVYTGSAWVIANAGMVRVGGGSLSGSSTAFTNIFSATYNNYIFSFSNLTGSQNMWLTIQLGSTTTGYYYGQHNVAFTNRASFDETIYATTSGGGGTLTICNPFLAKYTTISVPTLVTLTTGIAAYYAGFLNNTTSYTGFTIGTSGGTCTGTLDVYGLALS